jgi:hypothetical protein
MNRSTYVVTLYLSSGIPGTETGVNTGQIEPFLAYLTAPFQMIRLYSIK